MVRARPATLMDQTDDEPLQVYRPARFREIKFEFKSPDPELVALLLGSKKEAAKMGWDQVDRWVDGSFSEMKISLPSRREKINAEIRKHNAEMRRQRKLLKLLDRFGDADEFEDGAILAADLRYRDSDKTYSYAVVKAVGKYYVTGSSRRETPGPFTWEEFVIDFLGKAEEVHVYWAKDMTEIGKRR